jgi:hypothetical protein
MTRFANLTRQAQSFAVFALCIGTALALPLTLVGFQAL